MILIHPVEVNSVDPGQLASADLGLHLFKKKLVKTFEKAMVTVCSLGGIQSFVYQIDISQYFCR